MNLDQARAVVVQEARELLAEMDAALLYLESSGYASEQVNAVFRAVHTIKGSASLFALENLVSFSHTLESVLEQVRSGETPLDTYLLTLFFNCGDYIGSMVTELERAREHHDPDPVLRDRLLSELHQYLGPSTAQSIQVPSDALSSSTSVVDLENKPFGSPHWHISLRPSADVLRHGLEPISFLRYLSSLGRIAYLHTFTESIAQGAEFDPEQNYLGYEIEFETDAGREAIEEVFEFIGEHCLLRILPPYSPAEAYCELIASLPESPERLFEVLRTCAALDDEELQQVSSLLTNAAVTTAQSPSEQLPGVVEVSGGKGPDERRSSEQLFIKVEVSKLDELINLVGELVIAEASVRVAQQQGEPQNMQEACEMVAGLVEHIRDVSLALRMVAIGEVFQRFPRVVRDMSREMGKDIELHISGADTELDKSMVEKLTDPLMHLVRNAIDHGVESAHERVATGKPALSILRLNAYHDSGSVVIEVSDDGRGLDRQRIYEKGLEKGLLKSDQPVTDREVFDLVFHAGLSTAETVSNLSGRGVGMDVVRTNIEKLRGDVEVFSIAGQGTTVRVRLPLTLAIIEGFQVRVAGEAFVLPLDQVVECVDFSAQVAEHDLINLRGELLPYVRLRHLFGKAPVPNLRESLLVVQFGSSRAGVVVDQLVGELQAVIKPMGQLFAQNALLSGSTILGDGSVALILDVAQLIKRASAAGNALNPLSQHADRAV
jgi:two-component system chemotaxis sensor kinase CheA